MVLGKLTVLGRPTNLDESRARAYCACSRCRWGLFGHFFSHLSFLFSFSLSLGETARYRLKYCLKGPLSPKITNQHLVKVVKQTENILNKASQGIQSPSTVPFFLLVSLLDGYLFPNVLVKGIVAFKH